ncbi:MAG: hypothetical protein HQ521_18755 [Bacteroidetes bacterium]|nr:hypothetical protein [Bacteroidota bacterium]
MKVLYFDYWTKGLPHQILPLDRILANKGIDRILVHLGSWRDKSVKVEETIENLHCRDIKYYDNDIRKALVVEKPKVVYVLNMGGPMDKLVNRICRNLKIKTVFLMHGISPVGLDLIKQKKKENKAYSILYRLSKGFKYYKVYKMYGREILRYDFQELFISKTYGHLIQMIFSPGSMYLTPFIDRDLHTDRVLVYSKLFKEEFVKNMKVPIAKINIVGNPNLDTILKLRNSKNSKDRIDQYYKNLGLPVNKPMLIFLVDGLFALEESFVMQDWLNELKEVAGIADEIGWTLILKLHPSNDRQLVSDAMEAMHNVHIFQMEVDLSIVAGCQAAIGHVSSTLTIPIALHIPVFIPRWTKVYAEFDYYISNGAAIPCNSIIELRNFLVSIEKGKKFESSERNQFIDNCIGPLEGCTWEKVANEIEMLCK